MKKCWKKITWKGKEDPCSHFISSSETCKIEFPDSHGDCVLHRVEWVIEVPEVSTEDKIKEAAEGTKDDDEFHNKGGQSNKAKLDGGRNLFECFLETEISK